MCIASLHCSTQPCAHRWHELIQQCQPTNNLQNCPNKLRLQGWELKTDNCPWCDVDATLTTESTHRLLGGTSCASSTPSSPTIPALNNATPKRTDSFATVSSLAPLSRRSSAASTESERGRQHREMNERLHTYLNSHPHEVLPSAAKNYPTYPGRQSVEVQRPEVERAGSQRYSGVFSRQWRRKMKMNMSVFGF